MRHCSLWLPLLGAALAVGCNSSAPTNTTSDSPGSEPVQLTSEVAGPLADVSPGMVAGMLGLSQLDINPETLHAEVTTPHLAQTQGDLYHLSIRPFLRSGNVKVAGVTRGPGSTIDVDITFSHPFAAPSDLNPPASATKRIDLHIFDVTAMVVAEGSHTFFSGPDAVTTNANLLVNADGYRKPGETVNLSSLGVTNANVFPYKLVGNIDTGNPAGNYNPTANGWTGASLIAPTGYDVFPQGGTSTVTFRLDATNPISLNLVTLAKYMDPRSTPNPKSKRLPVAGDPTALQYILPEAAGDVQRLEGAVVGTLNSGSSSEIATLNLTILDWDHDAAVAGTFPNNSNLNEISEASTITGVELSAPQLYAGGVFAGGAVSGSGPLWTVSVPVNNQDLFSSPTPTQVLAMVKVADSQDDDDTTDSTKPIALNESLAPVTTLSSTRYQVVRFEVLASNAGPSCPVYSGGSWALEAVAGIPYNLDLDAASTPASDVDGIILYEIDYDNDGTYDSTVTATNGSDLPDFPGSFTYPVPGTQTIKLRITDGNVTPFSTECTLTVNISAPLSVTLDPLPVPGGINADMVNQSATTTVTDNPDILVAKPSGEVYFLLRRGSTPLDWVVYKSTDSATTWGAPNTITTPFPSPVNAQNSAVRGISLGIMNDGRPCFAGMDSGFDLLFKRSASETGTSINWGPTSEGSEIEIASDWYTPSVMPHPIDLNRLYILAKNNSSTLGVNPWSSTLWITNDATSPNPTFVQAGVMDVDGSTTNEFDPIATIDSVGNIHVAWCSQSNTGSAKYRKWNDTAQAWDGPEVVIGQVGVDVTGADDTNIAVNFANEPVVAFLNYETALRGNLVVTKFNTGSGWTKPRTVNNTNYPNLNSLRKYCGVAIDSNNRIHIVWREDGTTDAWDDTPITIFSADGRRKLTPDTNVFTATTITDDFTNSRIQYLPGVNKMLVTAYANGTVTDGKVRYRRYSF